MATWVHRRKGAGIESVLIDALDVHHHINSGWCFSKDDLTVKEEDSGKLSNKEIRAAAKEAGIEDWKKARVNKLKEILGYDD